MNASVNTNQLVPQLLQNGMVPCKNGPKGIPALLNFTLGTSFDLDLSQIIAAGFLDNVQTIYVDNSGNSNAFNITCSVSSQVLTVPAGAQAYLPLLQPSPAKLNFSTGGTPTITIQLLNFYLPPIVWSSGSANSAAQIVSDPTLDATVANGRVQTSAIAGQTTPNDKSGTITVGGTPQIIIATNAARKGYTIHNPSTATEVLQIMFGAAASGKIDLTPGSIYESGMFLYTGDIYAVAATAAHAFSAYEAT